MFGHIRNDFEQDGSKYTVRGDVTIVIDVIKEIRASTAIASLSPNGMFVGTTVQNSYKQLQVDVIHVDDVSIKPTHAIVHGNLQDIAVTLDGGLAVAKKGDNEIRFLKFHQYQDMPTATALYDEEPAQAVGHELAVTTLLPHPIILEEFASLSNDKTVRIWDANNAIDRKLGHHKHVMIPSVKIEGDSPLTMAFSPDGKWLTVGYTSRKLRSWKLKKRHEKANAKHDCTHDIKAVAFSASSTKMIAVTETASVFQYNLKEKVGKPCGTVGGDWKVVGLTPLKGDNLFWVAATKGKEGILSVYDTKEEKILIELRFDAMPVKLIHGGKTRTAVVFDSNVVSIFSANIV